MKKLYLKDIDTEKRNYLIKLNKRLADRLQADLYESNMEMQYIDSKNIMDDDALRAIEYHDHYSSFFYTLIDWRKFITGIDPCYLSTDARAIYEKICNKIDTLDSMDPYCENYDMLEQWLFNNTEIVLKDIENYLHEYEDYPSVDDAIQYADEMDQLNDYYIEIDDNGNSDNVIRLDVAFTETFI